MLYSTLKRAIRFFVMLCTIFSTSYAVTVFSISSIFPTSSMNKANRGADSIATESQALLQRLFQTTSTAYQNAHQKNDGNNERLYYFLSFSMPKPLIETYLQEATKDGGVVVFRGIQRNQTMSQFLLKTIYPFVRDRKAHAPIEIDPNKFEMYEVSVVPTMVVVENVKNKPYWKISGAVSSHYALEAFSEQGAPVNVFLERLR